MFLITILQSLDIFCFFNYIYIVFTGGTFYCADITANDEYAKAACESYHGGTCVASSCGYFFYYQYIDDLSCTCEKAVGLVEWIYLNVGYTWVHVIGTIIHIDISIRTP